MWRGYGTIASRNTNKERRSGKEHGSGCEKSRAGSARVRRRRRGDSARLQFRCRHPRRAISRPAAPTSRSSSTPVAAGPMASWPSGSTGSARRSRARGIRREERIFLCLLDTIDWPTAFLGALKAGVVAIPVNTLMTESDYEFMLTDSRASMLVVSEALLSEIREDHRALSRPRTGDRVGRQRARSREIRGPDRRRQR